MYSKDTKKGHNQALDKWIVDNKGSIAIAFTKNGQRYYWSKIGPYSDPTSLALANKICGDMLAIKLGTFTGNPVDYVPGYKQPESNLIQLPTAQTELNLKQVWELYKKARLGSISKSTADNALTLVDNAIKALTPTDLLPENASNLYNAIKQAIPTWRSDQGRVLKALEYISFASNLAARDQNKSPDIKYNYWGNVLSQIPTKNESSRLHLVADIKGEGKTLCYEDHGKKRPKCFTQDEIKAILDAINSNELLDKSSAFNHDFY